jgi:LPS export ABC transporter permease LptG
MRILDRYIIRELLLPILFCSIALIFLILIADVFDNLDDILRNQTRLSYIFQYYLSLMPISFVQTISWASLLGTVYLLVHFNHHNEVLAMKATGLSISKIARPILYVGFLVGIITFLVSDKIVPQAYLVSENIKSNKMEQKDDGTVKTKTFNDIAYSSPQKRLYYIGSLDAQTNKFENMILIILDQSKNIKRRVMAQSGYYARGKWFLEKVTSYETDPEGKLIGEPDHFDIREYPEIEETPQDFKEAAAEGDFLSYKELQGHIRKMEESGIQVSSERVDLQGKLASPWQSLIMILVALIFLARTIKRKAAALHVLFCLIVIFTYYVINALFMAVGKSGAISPFASAWAANFIFGIGCAVFFERGNE